MTQVSIPTNLNLRAFTYHYLLTSQYSPQLHPIHDAISGIQADINRLLTECESLVAFGAKASGVDGLFLLRGLQLPSRLRVLSLRHSNLLSNEMSGELLTEEKIKIIGDNLQSLTLHEANPPQSHECLTGSKCLAHLSIQLSSANVSTFLSALPSLPLLKALELDCPLQRSYRHQPALPVDNWDAVVLALAVNCPELEHLALVHWCNSSTATLSPDALTRLERLVSIEASARSSQTSDWDWDWMEALAEKGQLEHVGVSAPRMPVALACRVVEKCPVLLLVSEKLMASGLFQRLRYLDCGDSARAWDRWTHSDWWRLVEAAGNHAPARDGDQRAPREYPALSIYREESRWNISNSIHQSPIGDFSSSCHKTIFPEGSRLRFSSKRLKSHVLRRLEREWVGE